MEDQKRFQKKSLNSDDYKGTEQGAKVVKGSVGSIVAGILIYLNKDNIKAMGAGATNALKKIIKK